MIDMDSTLFQVAGIYAGRIFICFGSVGKGTGETSASSRGSLIERGRRKAEGCMGWGKGKEGRATKNILTNGKLPTFYAHNFNNHKPVSC